MLEAGNKWKDIGYSLVSKVWVVTKADPGFLWGKSRDCDYLLLNCITVKNIVLNDKKKRLASSERAQKPAYKTLKQFFYPSNSFRVICVLKGKIDPKSRNKTSLKMRV